MWRRIALLVFLALFPALGSLRAAPSRVDWKLSDVQLRGAKDSVFISGTWSFSNFQLKDNGAMVFSLFLRGSGAKVYMRPVVIFGRKLAYTKLKESVSGDDDEIGVRDLSRPLRLEFEEGFPLADGMDTLSLFITISDWTKLGGRSVRSTALKNVYFRPDGPEDFSFSWHDLVPDPYEGEYRELEYSFPIVFNGTGTKFDRMYESNATYYPKLLFATKSFTCHTRFKVRSSSLSLYVPPEGKSKESVKLSRQRVQSLYEALRKDGAFTRITSERVGAGEDWEGVRQWVSRSRVAGDIRLREILSWTGKDDAKAGAIRTENPAVWDILREECFPGLGRVVLSVSFRPLVFQSGNFILPVYDDFPEALCPRDFYRLAGIYEHGNPDWLQVVTTGSDLNPDCPELAFDAAMALLDAGMVNRAAVYLRRCGRGADADYAKAYWLYKSGRYSESLEILDVLSSSSSLYKGVYEAAQPLIEWEANGTAWRAVTEN